MTQNNAILDSTSSEVRWAWVHILTLPLPSAVTLHNLFNLCVLQFPRQ